MKVRSRILMAMVAVGLLAASCTSSTSEPEIAVTAATEVANVDYLGNYELVDDDFGTRTTVTVEDGLRTVVSNTLPNHETGQFPNAGNPNTISAQDRTWTLTTTPTYTGQPTELRETGVALNGVKFEPGTAERVECATGEQYRIEGLQDTFDLGMDFNNAHVQPTGEYHYHGVSELLVQAYASDRDLVLVGFANDGHLIYYSKSNAYPSGYSLSADARTGTDCDYRGATVDLQGTPADGTYTSDWVYASQTGALDECSGTLVDETYAYFITDEYPYVPRCVMGEAPGGAPGGGAPGGAPVGEAPGGAPVGEAPGGAPGGGAPAEGGAPPRGGEGARPGPGGPPDLDAAATALGVSVDELRSALGPPPPDLAAAATALGITEQELMAALGN